FIYLLSPLLSVSIFHATCPSPFSSSLSSFLCSSYADRRDLHSFPTRRSSDLPPSSSMAISSLWSTPSCWRRGCRPAGSSSKSPRSEEHTSELQSRFDLVCRLLLEKKK